MTHTSPSRPLPEGLLVAGSIAVVLHLSVFVVYVIGQSSGPWPVPVDPGISMVDPPFFTLQMREMVKDYYLQPMRMTHTYRFRSNKSDVPGVQMEARLKYANGKEETILLPDKNAWPWIRYRQVLLAQGLGGDERVFPMGGETVPAPNKQVQTVKIWESESEKEPLKLKTVPEHLVPRDRPVFKPSPMAEILARSYMRFLAREYKAASVEIIRRSRDSVRPESLLLPQLVGNFDEFVCSFGEYREK
ncbi:MAG: hypothetical protein L0Y72_32185 [Gemmataceae bacterium]|nr:hypothetical protein [Gemmataceae bacterium]MCI0743715.1 hypothetical protein [Gemmataceae bacterium]